MLLLRVMSRQSNGLRSTGPRSFTSTISASCQGAVKSKARMKARRVISVCTGKGAGNLRLPRADDKLRPGRLHELDPDHVALFQATLQALPGDVQSSFN